MQVDEEAKGASKNFEFGGYDSDSEDEREKKEIEEGKTEHEIVFNEAGKAVLAKKMPTKVVIVSCEHSKTMANIMYGQSWVDVAEARSTAVNSEKADKTKTAFTIYHVVESTDSAIYFLVPDLKKMSGDAVNPLVTKLFE